MTQLTVRQAAVAAGISRVTMFRYIKEGRVSSTLNAQGVKQVDTAEIMRVFGPLLSETETRQVQRNNTSQVQKQIIDTATVAEIEKLKAQLELEQYKRQAAEERAAEAVSMRDKVIALLEQQTRLLAATAQAPEPGLSKKKKRKARE